MPIGGGFGLPPITRRISDPCGVLVLGFGLLVLSQTKVGHVNSVQACAYEDFQRLFGFCSASER